MIIFYYIKLTKPNIILGNILSIIGGFFMASQGKINYDLLFKTIIGTSLIIASNCVLNNIIERPIDLLMKRTKNRALVFKIITPKNAFIYAIVLIFLGFTILFYETNFQVIYLSIISSIIYVGIYSLLIKKKTIYSTLIGSISGATPPAIGYCSVTNHFNKGTFILIILFIAWQMSHFYSIAIFRATDYKSAKIPTFPSKMGNIKTKQHIICYIIIFMINVLVLKLNNYVSYTFLVFMETLTGYWLYTAITGKMKDTHSTITDWGKKMFILSIAIIIFFNIAISIDSLLYHQKNYLSFNNIYTIS